MKVIMLYTIVIGFIMRPHFLKESNLTMTMATQYHDGT